MLLEVKRFIQQIYPYWNRSHVSEACWGEGGKLYSVTVSIG